MLIETATDVYGSAVATRLILRSFIRETGRYEDSEQTCNIELERLIQWSSLSVNSISFPFLISYGFAVHLLTCIVLNLFIWV